MKRITIVLFGFLMASQVHSQTNTFPETGSVGIGTTSPGAKLDVKSYGDGAAIFKLSTERAWQFEQRFTGASSRLQLRSLAGSKYFNIVDYNNSNIVASFYARGNESCVGIGKLAYTAYTLDVNGSGRFSGSVFLATSSGNVGIGTTNPQNKLHIKDGGDQYAGIRFTPTNGSNASLVGGFRGTGLALAGGGGISSTYRSFIYLRDEYIQFSTKPGTTGSEGDVTERMRIMNNGDVAIGTTDPKGFKLAVNGSIRTKEVVVTADNWPDYVFSPTYNLRSLAEVEQHITTNGHLPDVPNAQTVEENGIGVGEMNALLLKKIEELTLYLIEKDKENKEQDERIMRLENELSQLSKALNN